MAGRAKLRSNGWPVASLPCRQRLMAAACAGVSSSGRSHSGGTTVRRVRDTGIVAPPGDVSVNWLSVRLSEDSSSLRGGGSANAASSVLSVSLVMVVLLVSLVVVVVLLLLVFLVMVVVGD